MNLKRTPPKRKGWFSVVLVLLHHRLLLNMVEKEERQWCHPESVEGRHHCKRVSCFDELSMTRYASFFPLPAPYGKFSVSVSPPVPKKGTTIMCERSTLAFQEVDREIAGEHRRIALYTWVADDLAKGDRTLTKALGLWRDEVTARLQWKNAVTRIRIPWIFVGTLQLADQTVLLYEDGAVCIGGPKVDGSYMPGPLLVPPNKT